MSEEDGVEGSLTRCDQIQGRNSCSTRSEPLFLMLIWRLVAQEGLTGYGVPAAKLFLLNFSRG